MALVRMERSPYWWLDISVPAALHHVHGERIRKSTESTDKKLAQRYHDKVKADLWRQDKLDERPSYTIQDAIDRWKKRAVARGMRDLAGAEFQLQWWAEKLGPDKALADIRRADIMRAVEGKMTIPKSAAEKPRPATAATVNRYLAAIRGLLRLASREWDMVDSVPNFSLMREPKGRVRTLDKPDIAKLLAELPEWARDPFLLALSTGLRKGNVVPLQWSMVDLVRARLLVGADDFKNGNDFGIPLNRLALSVLTRNHGRHPTAVFTRGGKPLLAIDHKVWKAALQRAGVANFKWHDIRHVWATTMVEAGTDLDTLQKLGGWESREMVTRYAHLRTEHLRGSSSNLDKVFGDLLPEDPQVVPIGAAHLGQTAA
jgi:integrase